jgi:hypothetical protein
MPGTLLNSTCDLDAMAQNVLFAVRVTQHSTLHLATHFVL